MVITTKLKRTLIAWAFDQAVNSGTSLREVLVTQRDPAVASILTGRDIASVTGDGHSTTFAFSSDPRAMSDCWGELLELFDQSSSDLVTSGIAAPTDSQVKTEMLYRLEGCVDFTNDFTLLRP